MRHGIAIVNRNLSKNFEMLKKFSSTMVDNGVRAARYSGEDET